MINIHPKPLVRAGELPGRSNEQVVRGEAIPRGVTLMAAPLRASTHGTQPFACSSRIGYPFAHRWMLPSEAQEESNPPFYTSSNAHVSCRSAFVVLLHTPDLPC